MIRRLLSSPVALYCVFGSQLGMASLTAVLTVSAIINHRTEVWSVQVGMSSVFVLVNLVGALVVWTVANRHHDCPSCLCIRESELRPMARKARRGFFRSKVARYVANRR